MKIRQAAWKHCKSCGQRTKQIRDEVFGCDECGKKIEIVGKTMKHHDFLEVKVFNEGKESESLQFCGWKCVLNHLPKVRSNYFASLPFLHFDGDVIVGQRAEDFFRELKKRKGDK